MRADRLACSTVYTPIRMVERVTVNVPSDISVFHSYGYSVRLSTALLGYRLKWGG